MNETKRLAEVVEAATSGQYCTDGVELIAEWTTDQLSKVRTWRPDDIRPFDYVRNELGKVLLVPGNFLAEQWGPTTRERIIEVVQEFLKGERNYQHTCRSKTNQKPQTTSERDDADAV